ncbi:MAG: beta strand repeat-containing protein [Tenuifilaceae bacterium]
MRIKFPRINYLSNAKIIIACLMMTMLFSSFITYAQTSKEYAVADVATLKSDLAAGTYDIYILSESGNYTFTSTSSTAILLNSNAASNSATIMAKSGLATKPIISINGSSTSSTAGILIPNKANFTLTLQGIEFTGINAGVGSQPILVKSAVTATNCNIIIRDCYIHDFKNAAGNGTVRLDATSSSMDIQNSVFDKCYGRVLFFGSTDGNNTTTINTITNGDFTLKNCTFSNIDGSAANSNCVVHYKSSGGVWAKGVNATIDHCTFYKFAPIVGGTDEIFKFRLMSGEIKITNNIFDQIGLGYTFALPPATIDYNYLAGFANPPVGTNTFTSIPTYIDASTLNFALTNRTSFTCDDGFTVGNTIYYPIAPKLATPVVGTASTITTNGFTANWTKVDYATGYSVKVYLGTTLISTNNVMGQAVESLAITGLITGTTYTYKVIAKGDAVNYINSDISLESASFTTLGLPAPVVGVASSITTTGYTANWSVVSNASGYEVLTYFQTTLINTTSISGQTSNSVAVSGLTQGTSYTYKVIAVGDGTTFLTSSPSTSSAVFVTLPTTVSSINTNFGDGTWGIVTPPPSSLLPSVLYTFSVNGFNISDGVLYGASPTGLKGEIHTNVIRLNRNVNSKLEFPSVNSLEQIEIHASGTAAAVFSIKEYNTATSLFDILVGTYTLSGGVEDIFTISISKATASKFRIENGSSSSLQIHQIITRTTNPTIIKTPTVGNATSITGNGFTANWTPDPTETNATGYKVFVYATNAALTSTTLRNTFTASGLGTTSLAVTGIDTAAICTYKVLALGDGDNLYLDSYLSAASASFAVARLATPVVGLATALTTTGFTANWSTVANALSYDVRLYQGATLLNTVNVNGQASVNYAFTGLATNTIYTYTVTAKGDGTTTFDSKESVASANVVVLPVITLPSATAITTTGATLGGTIDSGAALTERGTVWGTTANPTENNLAEGGTSDGVFTQIRTGMIPNTLYHYRVYAVFSAGTGYSEDATFTTLSLAPSIAIPTNISITEFTANWTAPATQGTETFTYTLEVATDDAFTAIVSTITDISSSTLSKVVTGLAGGVDYYYRVKVVNAGGSSAYSSSETLTTTNIGSPILSTATASQINTTGLTIESSITESLTPVTERGTVWGTSVSPKLNLLIEGGTEIGAFSHVRTGMTPNTHYYFRAYAINSVGKGYSPDGNFTTLSLAPTVAAETSITATSFTANWSAPATQGNEVFTYTVEVSKDITFASGVTSFSNISESTLSKSITDLTASTNYYYRVMVVNAGGNSDYSNAETVRTAVAEAPVLTTPTVTSITATGATLGGLIVSNGGETLSARGTLWGLEADPTTNQLAEGGTDVGTFSHARTGMTPNTQYHFRGYASNTAQTGYSSDATFTTLSLPPTIANATAITSSGFTANWSAPAAQGSQSFTYTLEVSTDNTFTAAVTSFTGLSSLSKAVTGLTFSTNYYYRVMVVNAGGNSAYSSISNLTTLSYASLPTVSLITTTGATLGGTVIAFGDAIPIARGTVWGTSPNPTTNQLAEGGIGISSFTHARTGMVPNTNYYFRAYATYGTGTGYSTDGTFTTISLAPTIAAATNVTNKGFTANWNAPAAQGSAEFTYILDVSMDNTFLTGVLTISEISSSIRSYTIPFGSPGSKYYYRVCIKNAGGYSAYTTNYATVTTTTVGVLDQELENSSFNYYPNPAVNNLNFEYSLLENTNVQLSVYTLNGQLVNTLLDNKNQQVGTYTNSFDVSGLNSGVYFARFTTGRFAKTFKLVIAR